MSRKKARLTLEALKIRVLVPPAEDKELLKAHRHACELLTESPLPVLIGLGDSTGRGISPILAEEARAEAEISRYKFVVYWLYISEFHTGSLRYLLRAEGVYGPDRLIAEWWIGAHLFLEEDLKKKGHEDLLLFFERTPYALGVASADSYARDMFWRIMPPPTPSSERAIRKAVDRLSLIQQMIRSEDPKLLDLHF